MTLALVRCEDKLCVETKKRTCNVFITEPVYSGDGQWFVERTKLAVSTYFHSFC